MLLRMICIGLDYGDFSLMFPCLFALRQVFFQGHTQFHCLAPAFVLQKTYSREIFTKNSCLPWTKRLDHLSKFVLARFFNPAFHQEWNYQDQQVVSLCPHKVTIPLRWNCQRFLSCNGGADFEQHLFAVVFREKSHLRAQEMKVNKFVRQQNQPACLQHSTENNPKFLGWISFGVLHLSSAVEETEYSLAWKPRSLYFATEENWNWSRFSFTVAIQTDQDKNNFLLNSAAKTTWVADPRPLEDNPRVNKPQNTRYWGCKCWTVSGHWKWSIYIHNSYITQNHSQIQTQVFHHSRKLQM